MSVVFPPIFLVDTNLIYGYNFVAPLIKESSKRTNLFGVRAQKLCKRADKFFRHVYFNRGIDLDFFLSDYPESFISGNIV